MIQQAIKEEQKTNEFFPLPPLGFSSTVDAGCERPLTGITF
jgi:hypothetical protein